MRHPTGQDAQAIAPTALPLHVYSPIESPETPDRQASSQGVVRVMGPNGRHAGWHGLGSQI